MNIKMLEQYGIAHTELKMAFVIFLPEQTRASCERGFWLSPREDSLNPTYYISTQFSTEKSKGWQGGRIHIEETS
jgi:hypothetical protein